MVNVLVPMPAAALVYWRRPERVECRHVSPQLWLATFSVTETAIRPRMERRPARSRRAGHWSHGSGDNQGANRSGTGAI